MEVSTTYPSSWTQIISLLERAWRECGPLSIWLASARCSWWRRTRWMRSSSTPPGQHRRGARATTRSACTKPTRLAAGTAASHAAVHIPVEKAPRGSGNDRMGRRVRPREGAKLLFAAKEPIRGAACCTRTAIPRGGKIAHAVSQGRIGARHYLPQLFRGVRSAPAGWGGGGRGALDEAQRKARWRLRARAVLLATGEAEAEVSSRTPPTRMSPATA